MESLNETDFLIRLRLASCCSGTKGSELLSKIKIGAKDVDCKLKELQIIQGMIESLKCYKVLNDTEVLATGSIEIVNLVLNETFEFFINGVTLIGPRIITTTNIAVAGPALTAFINSYQDVYTATYDSGTVTLTGTCKNYPLDVVISGGDKQSVINTTDFHGGACEITEADNCLTEEQVQSMFNYIQTKCKLCFAPLGTEYS